MKTKVKHNRNWELDALDVCRGVIELFDLWTDNSQDPPIRETEVFNIAL